MEEKDVYVGTRIPDDLKKAFQEALEKDGRNYTIAQILRYWIERFVISNQDQGLTFNSEKESLIAELKNKNEYYSEMVEKLFDLTNALLKVVPTKQE